MAAPRGTEFPCCSLKRAASPAYRKPLPGPTESAVMRTASAKPVRRRSTPGGGEGAGEAARKRRVEEDEDAAVVGAADQPAVSPLQPQAGQAVVVGGAAEGAAPRFKLWLASRRVWELAAGDRWWEDARGRRVARLHGRRRGRVDRQTLFG